jgi:hypothetical protein
MNPVAVVLLTYERTAYAVETLVSFMQNIHYSGNLFLHIADDGSRPEHLQELMWCARVFRDKVSNVPTVTNGERGGYGRNYNLAMEVVHEYAPIILSLEDDWKLMQPLDLDPLVEDLEAQEFGCCRLGYIGFTQDLRGKFFYTQSRRMYLSLDPDSPEPHVFAGHPRLEAREWQRSVGPWTEGLSPGDTEFEVAHRPAARQGVVWPLDLVKSWGDVFSHIGTIRSTEVEESP